MDISNKKIGLLGFLSVIVIIGCKNSTEKINPLLNTDPPVVYSKINLDTLVLNSCKDKKDFEKTKLLNGFPSSFQDISCDSIKNVIDKIHQDGFINKKSIYAMKYKHGYYYSWVSGKEQIDKYTYNNQNINSYWIDFIKNKDTLSMYVTTDNKIESLQEKDFRYSKNYNLIIVPFEYEITGIYRFRTYVRKIKGLK
jgi:hypothetical protein